MRRIGNLVMAAVVVVAAVAALDPVAATADESGPAVAGKVVGRAEEPAATVSYGGSGVQGVSPARLLDTRPTATTIDGIAAGAGPVGAGDVVELTVAGRGGVPEIGAGAVVLNVTATGATAATHVTVFPTGGIAPKASNLNVGAGDTAPNLVVVKVGRGGKVSLRNNSGATHLLADVMGWFPEGSGFAGVSPARLLDTRSGATTIDGVAAGVGAVGAKATISVPVTGRGGVPADAGAVVVNITATGPTAPTHVTVFPTGAPTPNASNLNLAPGQTRPNLVIVKVGADGSISLRNNAGSTHLIADVLGWFPPDVGFTGLAPARLLDTRPAAVTIDGVAAGGGAVGPKATVTVPVTGRGGVPADAGAVALNVTVTGPTDATHITAYPAGETAPKASNLNATAGQTVPNLVIVKVGADGKVALRNNSGSAHLIADVLGWFPDPDAGSQTMIGIKDGTVLAGAGDVTSATWSTPTAGTATVAPSGDVPPVGGHLAVNPSPEAPEGFLGTVTATTPHPDGTTTVAVTSTNLQDAFTDLDVDGPIAPPPGGTDAGAGAGQVALSDGCEGAVSAGITRGYSLGTLDGDFEFSLRRRYARLEATVEPTVSLSGSLSNSFTCTETLGKVKLGVTGPVLWEAALTVTLTASAAGTIDISASAPITIGFEYEDGDATNLSSLDINGGGDIAAGASVTGSLSYGIQGGISGKAWGLAGFAVEIGPEVTASWDMSDDCVTIDAVITASISAEIGRWGIDWSFTLAEVSSPKVNLYKSDGCVEPWTGTVVRTWNPEYVNSLGGTFTVTIDEDVPPYKMSSNDHYYAADWELDLGVDARWRTYPEGPYPGMSATCEHTLKGSFEQTPVLRTTTGSFYTGGFGVHVRYHPQTEEWFVGVTAGAPRLLALITLDHDVTTIESTGPQCPADSTYQEIVYLDFEYGGYFSPEGGVDATVIAGSATHAPFAVDLERPAS